MKKGIDFATAAVIMISLEDGNKKEEVESTFNPYVMDTGDDLQTRIGYFDNMAKDADPTATIQEIEWQGDRSRYAIRFEGDHYWFTYYVNVR